MKGVKSEENRNHKKLISFVSFTIFNCYSSQLCSVVLFCRGQIPAWRQNEIKRRINTKAEYIKTNHNLCLYKTRRCEIVGKLKKDFNITWTALDFPPLSSNKVSNSAICLCARTWQMLGKMFSAHFARRQESLHLLATVYGWQGQIQTFKTGNAI